MVDERIGRLTVLYSLGTHADKWKQRWVCRCDCGRICIKVYYQLMTNKDKHQCPQCSDAQSFEKRNKFAWPYRNK